MRARSMWIFVDPDVQHGFFEFPIWMTTYRLRPFYEFYPSVNMKKITTGSPFLDDVVGALLMDIPAEYCTLDREAIRLIFHSFLLRGFYL
jgi:hypothetical protein